MILILSNREDVSTSAVIDWLLYFGQKVIRISPNYPIEVLDITIDNCNTDINFAYNSNILFRLSEITAFWYRRGYLNFIWSDVVKKKLTDKYFLSQIGNDINCIEEFLHFCFSRKRGIGNYYKGNVNKLISLELAISCGFKIPSTLLTTQKSGVIVFNNSFRFIINKPIFLPHSFTLYNKSYSAGTNRVSKPDLESMPKSFFPSLFQQEVKKIFEIRTFFLVNKCYSMAIFSQGNTLTEVDFRNYDNSNPNRMIPYILPNEIEAMVKEFMDKIGLNSGSLDIIYATDGHYYFLEVNPVGQYGMTSRPCNYQLNKEIAKYLINE
jgi:ATP-GRASP peptide maturase of grasp-with-spasm system